MKKSTLYLFGLITLIGFPIPTVLWFYFYKGVSLFEVFDLAHLSVYPVAIGWIIGALYAYFALIFMQSEVFDNAPVNIERIIRRMNLNIWDCLFISFCAGFGEELLFRAGVQYYLGPIITSIIFVAIHGYLNPLNWRMSLYGLIVLPFILLISYGYYEFGLWFSIGAHFSYDFILFRIISDK